jgi:hypothetical protein
LYLFSLVVVLPWWKPDAAVKEVSGPSINKVCVQRDRLLGGLQSSSAPLSALVLPIGRGGEEEGKSVAIA